MTAEQIRHARDLLTRPDNTVSAIARLLGVSRASIYKYVARSPPGAQPPPAFRTAVAARVNWQLTLRPLADNGCTGRDGSADGDDDRARSAVHDAMRSPGPLSRRRVSRIPFTERVLAQDGLLRWHRRVSLRRRERRVPELALDALAAVPGREVDQPT